MHHDDTAAQPRSAADRAAAGSRLPAQIFQGYDTFAACALSTAVEGTSPTDGGQERCHYTVCDSVESLYTSIDISASAAASSAFGSVDAKTKYVNQLSLTTTSIVMVVHASKILGTTRFTDVSLRPGVQPPGSDDELIRFHRAYGDSFVSEIVTGGEYIATYTFYCRDISERTQVQAALSASGISPGGNVTAKLEAAIQQVLSTTSVHISFDQVISGISNLKMPIEQEMIQFGLDFATHVLDTPAVLSYETQGYEHVTGMIPVGPHTDLWAPVTANRSLFQGRDGINAQAPALDSLENQADWIGKVYAVYNYQDDTVLRSRKADIVQDKQELKTAIRALDGNPTIPFVPPQLQSLTYGSPVLTFDGPAVPAQWGSDNGGDPFSDVTSQSVRMAVKLDKVELHGGNRVDQLKCTYSNGQATSHGGNGGDWYPAITLGPHEYISALWGHASGDLGNLKVITDKGQSTEAGRAGGDQFSWTVPPGSVVVGLSGRCGNRLDRVGPMVCKFNPATWVAQPVPLT
jgi:hypothetical protein